MIDYSKEVQIFKPKTEYISAIQWNGKNLEKINKFVNMSLLVSHDNKLIIPIFNDKQQFITAKDKADINDFVVEENGEIYFVKEYDFLNQYEILGWDK